MLIYSVLGSKDRSSAIPNIPLLPAYRYIKSDEQQSSSIGTPGNVSSNYSSRLANPFPEKILNLRNAPGMRHAGPLKKSMYKQCFPYPTELYPLAREPCPACLEHEYESQLHQLELSTALHSSMLHWYLVSK